MRNCLAYAIVLQTKDESLLEKLKVAVSDAALLVRAHVEATEHDIEVYIDDKYDDPID